MPLRPLVYYFALPLICWEPLPFYISLNPPSLSNSLSLFSNLWRSICTSVECTCCICRPTHWFTQMNTASSQFNGFERLNCVKRLCIKMLLCWDSAYRFAIANAEQWDVPSHRGHSVWNCSYIKSASLLSISFYI